MLLKIIPSELFITPNLNPSIDINTGFNEAIELNGLGNILIE